MIKLPASFRERKKPISASSRFAPIPITQKPIIIAKTTTTSSSKSGLNTSFNLLDWDDDEEVEVKQKATSDKYNGHDVSRQSGEWKPSARQTSSSSSDRHEHDHHHRQKNTPSNRRKEGKRKCHKCHSHDDSDRSSEDEDYERQPDSALSQDDIAQKIAQHLKQCRTEGRSGKKKLRIDQEVVVPSVKYSQAHSQRIIRETEQTSSSQPDVSQLIKRGVEDYGMSSDDEVRMVADWKSPRRGSTSSQAEWPKLDFTVFIFKVVFYYWILKEER